MPEQYFDSLVGMDRTANVRDALADYSARVEGNIADAASREKELVARRVASKRRQKDAYRAAVSARLEKEAVIFGGDEPLQVQW